MYFSGLLDKEKGSIYKRGYLIKEKVREQLLSNNFPELVKKARGLLSQFKTPEKILQENTKRKGKLLDIDFSGFDDARLFIACVIVFENNKK